MGVKKNMSNENEIHEIDYHEEGVVKDTISAMVMLFIGIGVIVLVVILVGVIGGKAYSTTQSDISSITDSTIKTDINASILAGFSGLADAAGFLGIIVLALVFFLVLVLLSAGMGGFAGGGQRAF